MHKKIPKILLVFVLIVQIFLVGAQAGVPLDDVPVIPKPETGELRVISINVDGLPMFKEGGRRNPWLDTARMGSFFSEGAYCIVGTQEEFNVHGTLSSHMSRPEYPYRTVHQGGVPAGDGLNVYSRSPIFNQERFTWRKAYGVLGNLNDELTPKGFLRVEKQLPVGFIDVYVVHADAGEDPGSVAARTDNFKQIAEEINKRPDRAVVLIGDFNTFYQVDPKSGNNSIEKDLIPLVPGLRDVWAEAYEKKLPHGTDPGAGWCQENGDSIDHILVKDGGGFTFTVQETLNLNLQYINKKTVGAENWILEGKKRHSLSDHAAKYAKIVWNYDGYPREHIEDLTKPHWTSQILGEQCKAFFHSLGLIFSETGKLITGRAYR